MIQIAAGDLIAVEAEGSYSFALIIDRVRLFGGNWVFVFYRQAERLLEPSELLGGPVEGFNAFVDFIWAKRENRVTRLARKQDTARFRGPGYLKTTLPFKGVAPVWFIYDMTFNEVRRVSQLNPIEATFPDYGRIDDSIMIERIRRRWTPDQDPRIHRAPVLAPTLAEVLERHRARIGRK